MRLAALFVLGAVLAGCEDPEQAMENTVRATLTDRGNVQEVDMTQGSDGNMTGHAVVAAANGQSARYNCAANKVGDGGTYRIACVPAIDEAMLQAMEAEIRRTYEQRGAQVLEVDMQKQDEDHMRGHMVGSDGSGAQARLTCTAERDTATNQFPWQCVPEGEAAAGAGAAPAAGAQAAGGASAGGKDPAGGKPGDGEMVDGEILDAEGGK
ncbi:MAG TPA: hypothetical protein VEZ20_02200 [Allosphingosinicella sp.]|nr:hypothetical protein [Allosphingosinicella sp.]